MVLFRFKRNFSELVLILLKLRTWNLLTNTCLLTALRELMNENR